MFDEMKSSKGEMKEMFDEMKSSKGEMEKMFDEMKPETAEAGGMFCRVRGLNGDCRRVVHILFSYPLVPLEMADSMRPTQSSVWEKMI